MTYQVEDQATHRKVVIENAPDLPSARKRIERMIDTLVAQSLRQFHGDVIYIRLLWPK